MNKHFPLAIALLTSSQAFAKTDSTSQNFQLAHFQEEITVDGLLDENVWQNATKMTLGYENNPGEGIKASVKTEMWLFEDGDALHIGIKAYDPDPRQIRASLRDRDALWDDDNVGIIIDTFNDERGGYEFFVNPFGAQADMKMDDTNGWNEDSSWDAIWNSAGQITDFGYSVELVIPLSALRFPEADGELTWSIAGWRNYPRDVRKQFATYKRNRDIKCNLCQMDKLTGFKAVKPSQNFQLTPTLTVSQSGSRDDVTKRWDAGAVDDDGGINTEGDVNSEVGLDLRWGVTKDIVMNATLNPDFSQVEADSTQLDINNTFSLFYREKRAFFLDGASYFDAERFNFVHTRNIADPDFGVKVTGKTDSHSFGLMVANDNNTSFVMPGSQGSDIATLDQSSDVLIGKYKADISGHSNLGVLVTHRESEGYSNTLSSFDGSHSLNDTDTINFNLAHSSSKNTQLVVDDFDVNSKQDDHAVSIGYNHNSRKYGIWSNYTNVGDDFRADLGFMTRVNYEQVVLGGERKWYGDSDDLLTRWGVFGDWDKTYDQDGLMLEEEWEIHGNLQGQKQFYSNFGVVHRNRYYEGRYYKETQPMMYAQITPLSGIRLEMFTRLGTQIDFENNRLGDRITIEPGISWDVNQHIKVQYYYAYNSLDIEDKELYSANQNDLRLTYQFDMRSNLKFVLQYTDIDRDPELYLLDESETDDDRPDRNSKYYSSQLIYSYKVNPQTLFYLGYADGGYQDDDLQSLKKNQRTAFVKFSYAWQK
ncbi:MAG: carbohydrate binding family 9 domain-containing protein [Gammaproteobacteria bacterium]|nr:carbohydrate binding family 9 domain-containing protein [Gammaproteobacteria bacterium]